MSTTITGPDGKPRCRWCGDALEFLHYHDTEWGFPVSDDHRLFEKLSLEGFQSGLSWRTILVKREGFRAAFHGFNFDKVAHFTGRDGNASTASSKPQVVQTIVRPRQPFYLPTPKPEPEPQPLPATNQTINIIPAHR